LTIESYIMSDSSVNGDLLAPARPSSSPNSKRKASDAGLPATGTRIHKSVKRRASKACQSCRARKVRCNVVEQSPCTNCRLDEVECIVSESKRKKLVPHINRVLRPSLLIGYVKEVDKGRRGGTDSRRLFPTCSCLDTTGQS
jgi:hypothetical protein